MSDEDHTNGSSHEASLDETDEAHETESGSPVEEVSSHPASDEEAEHDSDTSDASEHDETEADADPSETDDSPAEELEQAVTSADNVTEVDAENVETRQKHVITGGDFECELELDRETTAAFLEDLAHQLRTGHDLTVSGDDWEIPFEYAEPIEVEIEHEGDEDDEERELEIEIEFEWGGDESLEVR